MSKGKRQPGLKKRIAREAALLLYESQEKEYRQAKKKAAQTLGVRVLPSNIEVAEELDKIAEEREGSPRREMLVRMREEALQIMGALKRFHPRLVGSVWRGTAHKHSDIDILVFSLDAQLVLDSLEKEGYRIVSSEWRSVTKHGKKEASFHVNLILPSGDEVEVVVRSPERISQLDECEVYRDPVTGLTHSELREVLKERPFQKFLPK